MTEQTSAKAAGGSKPAAKSDTETKPKAKTYTTRHEANRAFWKLAPDKRADVKVSRDDKSGRFSIVKRGS